MAAILDADRLVICQICKKELAAKSLLGHIGKVHSSKMAEYKREFPKNAQDFHLYRRGVLDQVPAKKPSKKAVKVFPEGTTIEEELLDTLSASERIFYDQFSDEVFQQTDRDMVQTPIIMSLTFDMIQLKRYRATQISGQLHDDPKVVAALAEAMKNTEDRIRKQMDALGISRTAKLKNKAQIRSTPFCIISGYYDEMERMTPEQHQVLENEERKQLASMNERVQKWYLANAVDLEPLPEETEDGTLKSLDFAKILADANVEL